jgi:hypothetical protein
MITAPGRFGKSINLDMFRRFVELQVDKETGNKMTKVDLKSDIVSNTTNYELFTKKQNGEKLNLEIMKKDEFVKTHFGPVINVDFLCNETVTSKTDALNLCKKRIPATFEEHPYLYKYSESKLEDYERNVCEQWCGNPMQFEPTNVVEGLKNLSKYLNKFHKRRVFVFNCNTGC